MTQIKQSLTNVLSALDDHRFNPIPASDLSRLECCVSLLEDFTPQDSYLDWEIGVHGIWISFKSYGRTRTATYLPEIALDQGWSKQEAIDSLLRKGGYSGTITEDFRTTIKLTTYTSSKAKCTYDEWQVARGDNIKN